MFPYGILSSRDSFNSYPRNSLSFWVHIHFLSRCYLWNQNGTECDAEQFSPWQMVSGSRANSVHDSQQKIIPFQSELCRILPRDPATGANQCLRFHPIVCELRWTQRQNRQAPSADLVNSVGGRRKAQRTDDSPQWLFVWILVTLKCIGGWASYVRTCRGNGVLPLQY